MNEQLEVGGLSFEVRRSTRRKTLGLTVDRGGELVLHCPQSTEVDDLTRWTRSKLLWVHGKLAHKEEMASKVREPEFVTGESFSYLGRSYRLIVVPEQPTPLRFDGHRFALQRDARASATDHFRRWYVETGRKWLTQRVASLTRKVGASPSRIEVRDLGFRWGSCGKNGVVYFDWRLLQLPVRLIDYVVTHELAHLVQPHHGPEFWRVLDHSLPDWRDRQAELRAKAREVYWCHAAMVQ